MYKKIVDVGEKIVKLIKYRPQHSYFVGFDLNLNFFFNLEEFSDILTVSHEPIRYDALPTTSEINKQIPYMKKYGDITYHTSNDCIKDFVMRHADKIRKIRIGGNSMGVGETLSLLNRNVLAHVPQRIISNELLPFNSSTSFFLLDSSVLSLSMSSRSFLEELLNSWNGVMSLVFDYKKTHRSIINSLWLAPYKVNKNALYEILSRNDIIACFLTRIPKEDIPSVNKYLSLLENKGIKLSAGEFYHAIKEGLNFYSHFSTFYSSIYDFLSFYGYRNESVSCKNFLNLINNFFENFLPKNKRVRFVLHSKDVEICAMSLDEDKEKDEESLIAGELVAATAAQYDNVDVKHLERLLFDDLGYKAKISNRSRKISKKINSTSSEMKHKNYNIYALPTILCEPITTVGLGDAFEAGELLYHTELVA